MSLGLGDLDRRINKHKKAHALDKVKPWAAGSLGFKEPKKRPEHHLDFEALDYRKPPFLWLHQWQHRHIGALHRVESQVGSWLANSIDSFKRFWFRST